jgi:hypothetical protein
MEINVGNDVQLLHVALTLPRGLHPHLVRICVGCFGWCCLRFSQLWEEYVGMFIGRVCLSLMERTTTMMAGLQTECTW